jgi:hypothetical protein
MIRFVADLRFSQKPGLSVFTLVGGRSGSVRANFPEVT